MKTYDKPIKDVLDVAEFFWHLLKDHGLCFHPDDDFACYVCYGTDIKVYDDEMAKKYDTLMGLCFDVCKKYGTDIYGIAIEQMQEHNKWQSAGKPDIRPNPPVKKAPRIIIEVKGGLVQEVYTDQEDLNIDVMDLDTIMDHDLVADEEARIEKLQTEIKTLNPVY